MFKAIICIIMLVFLISSASAGVRINEVMPHTNNSQGDEWVELYNNESVNISLIDWIIADAVSNDSFSLNISANGFALIIDDSMNCSDFNISNESCVKLSNIGSGLNDAADNLTLYNNSNLTDNFSWVSNIKSSGKSWQYCSGDWLENPPTPGLANNCTEEEEEEEEEEEDEPDPRVSLDWDEEDIINGKTFEITVKGKDLADEEYDVRIWIEDDDENIISDRYDSGEKKWKSGKYYLNDILEGSGDDDAKIKLRIKESYRDFKGKTDIFVKLREDGDDVVDEDEDDIEIIEAEDSDDVVDNEDNSSDDNNNDDGDDNLISLGSNLNETKQTTKGFEKNSIIYKSKSEYIKEYAIYGFSLLCMVMVILLLLDKN